MQTLLLLALIAQCSGTFLAVILNSFLIYIIIRFSHSNIGFYKYVLAAFALFQSVYAIVVFVGMPIHFIGDYTWMGFNYYGPISGTRFALLGPLTYCFFYEAWLGFVVVIFVYRYIYVCRQALSHKISHSINLKLTICCLLVFYLCVCGCCAYIFCPANKASEELLLRIQELFHLDNASIIAYYVMRFTNIDGSFSPLSATAILVHYAMILVSVSIITFCTIRLWATIKSVKNVKLNIKLERQLFKSLLIQTAIPVVLCHLPSLFAMSFPLWKTELEFWPFFSVFTTVPKALDPIISIVCINDFKKATMTVFGRPVISSTISPTGASSAINHTRVFGKRADFYCAKI